MTVIELDGRRWELKKDGTADIVGYRPQPSGPTFTRGATPFEVLLAEQLQGAVDDSGTVHVDALYGALNELSNDIDGYVTVAEVFAAVRNVRGQCGA